MTAIEQALFSDNSAHCVSHFDLSPRVLILTLHPWEHKEDAVRAQFQRPHVLSTDDSHAEEVCNLPWDIIGFDSEQLSNGSWRFCLHTDCIEYVFDSSWPQITKVSYRGGAGNWPPPL
jgi:hypothetical protein